MFFKRLKRKNAKKKQKNASGPFPDRRCGEDILWLEINRAKLYSGLRGVSWPDRHGVDR